MKELLLAAVFVAHAAAFAWLYFRRGRRSFNLLFVGGFALLATFHAGRTSLSIAGIEPEPSYLFGFRWGGLILCGLATPPFLIHWRRRRRGDPALGSDS